MNPIIVVPARMAASRLPGKPLADINGIPMIVHVWRRAIEADLGPVVVASDDLGICDVVQAAGGRAVMTRSDHLSGTDRVHEALEALDPDGRHDVVVNLQGDLPTIEAHAVQSAVRLLAEPDVAIGTLAAVISTEHDRTSPNIVKVVGSPRSERRLHALYFTRATAPWGEGVLHHHIGLYAYRRAALRQFVRLPPSSLERREKLEQLRAIEAGLRIDVAVVDTVPLGVDTPAELDQARAMLRTA